MPSDVPDDAAPTPNGAPATGGADAVADGENTFVSVRTVLKVGAGLAVLLSVGFWGVRLLGRQPTAFGYLPFLPLYLGPPYAALWFLAGGQRATRRATQVDRYGTGAIALGFVVLWGLFASNPPTPQSAQAGVALFLTWFVGALAYGLLRAVVAIVERMGS